MTNGQMNPVTACSQYRAIKSDKGYFGGQMPPGYKIEPPRKTSDLEQGERGLVRMINGILFASSRKN